MRAIGIDLGSKRIGVSLCDSGGLVATPYETVQRTGNRTRDREALLAIAHEVGAEAIIVGLPLSLDGSIGKAAKGALWEAEQLRAATSVPVETYDERLTTVTADRSLKAQNLGAGARRKMVDAVAAAVILQSWLDAGSPITVRDTDPGRDDEARGSSGERY